MKFISDTHFGHANIIEFDGRPFASIEEHDKVIAGNINDSLRSGETLYHLGDVAWSRKAYDQWVNIRRKDVDYIMIQGNHDHRIKGVGTGNWEKTLLVDYTGESDTFGDSPLSNPQHTLIWLSHYPHLSWPHISYGSIHLFGHVHGHLKGVGKSFDVSANVIGYKPISIEEIKSSLTANAYLLT